LAEVRERARDLQSQMLHASCSQQGPECFRPQVAGLRSVLRDYTVRKLNQSGGDTQGLIADLRTVDDCFALEVLGRKPGTDGRNPFTFRKKLAAGELLLTVNHFASGALAIPPGVVIVQGFRRQGDEYVFGAETGDSIYGIMNEDMIQALPSPVEGEIWLLISGQVAGFMGHLERTRIYSFNGYEFQERWRPEDRQNPEITITDDEIRTVYLGPKIYRFRGDLQECFEETVKLLSTGAAQVKLVNRGECGDPHKR
jgi:hypothetical protein